MKYVLKEYCHPIFELFEYLSRYVKHDSYQKLYEGFFKNNPNIANEQEKYTRLQDFLESLISESNVNQERLNFLFKERGEIKFTIADLLILVYIDWSIEDIGELSQHVYKCYKENGIEGLYRQFAICLDSQDNYDSYCKVDSRQFIEILNRFNLSDEDKYMILQLILDFPNLRKELDEILNCVNVVYQKRKIELNPYLHDFIEYWKPRFNEENVQEHFKNTFNVQLDEFDNGLVIYPSIMGINKGMLHHDATSVVMFWGISFIRDFNVNTIHVDKETLLEDLKVLSDPSKFEILTFISQKAAYGQEISKELNLTTATISHHMQALVNARIVNIEKIQNRIYYSMNRKNVEELIDGVKMILLRK